MEYKEFHLNDYLTIQYFLEYIDKQDEQSPELFWRNLYLLSLTFSLACAIAIPIIFLLFGIPIQFNADSARYLLSAIIQAQAAIIAIVISLTIVAIQVTTSAYSPRFIEVFKKHPALWLFLGMYTFSISITTILLSLITQAITINNAIILIFFIFDVSFFICLIAILIPHVRVTMNYLNALNIIEQLVKQISVDKIKPETDPFQPAFDVIYGAIKKDDYTTMSSSLILVRDKFIEIMAQGERQYKKQYISYRFFDDLKRCGFMLIGKKEERFAFEVLTRITDICDYCHKEEDITVLENAIKTLQELGSDAAQRKIGFVLDRVLKIFDEVYIKSKESHNYLKDSVFLASSYQTIAIWAINSGNYNPADKSIKQLCKFVDDNINVHVGLGNASVESLEKIIEVAIEKNEKSIANLALGCLYKHRDPSKLSDPNTLHGLIDFYLRKLEYKFKEKISEKKVL